MTVMTEPVTVLGRKSYQLKGRFRTEAMNEEGMFMMMTRDGAIISLPTIDFTLNYQTRDAVRKWIDLEQFHSYEW